MEPSRLLKICTRCKAEKEEEEFRWRVRHGPKARRGSWCKACCAEEARRYNSANKDAVRERIKNSPARQAAKARAQTSYVERTKLNILGFLKLAANRKISKCRRMGILCTLTAWDLIVLYDQQRGLCALTEVPLAWGPNGVMRDTLSIDRIDPMGGYVPGNMRLLTYQVNLAKGAFNDQELIDMAERLLRIDAKRRAYARTPEARLREQRLRDSLAPRQDNKTLLFPIDDYQSVHIDGRRYEPFRREIYRQRNGEWILEEANVVEVPERFVPEMASLGFMPGRKPPEPEVPKPPVFARPSDARKHALAAEREGGRRGEVG